MRRGLIIVSLENYNTPIMKAIEDNVTKFLPEHNLHPGTFIDIEEIFIYAILKSLTGILGINLMKDFLYTEVYDMFYNSYLEHIALPIAVDVIKMHSLMFLTQTSSVKTLVTFNELIISYRIDSWK